MKTKIYMFILFATMLLAGCGGDYDDTAIWNQVNSNKSRIEQLEKQVNEINAQITQLRSLIDALGGSGKTITSVRETATGYTISFSDGTTIEIKNGKDGKDGADAPVIGVKQDTDGIYYWTTTINGETIWLLDAAGNKLQATANAGKDGQDGQDGQDGVTPIISIDANGYWIVSYDGGQTFVFILDARGDKVLAKIDSSSSTTQIITNVYVTNEYLQITLYNYQTIKIPIDKAMSIRFAQSSGISLPDVGSSISIDFTVEGYDSNTFIETCVHGNLDVTLNYNKGSYGSITIKRTGDIDAYSKVLVFLCNTKKTITYVLTFTEQGGSGGTGDVDPRLPQVVPPEILIRLRGHMNIYDGLYPPNIEGVYVMDNPRVVYCEDEDYGGFPAGLTDTFAPMYFRFSNQNSVNNTLDYEETEGDGTLSGQGAYICGTGNNFTAFFNIEGYHGNIWVKQALVISGIWTSTGIKNMQYAFVMVDKKNDTKPEYMQVGVFRIFDDNDNLASKTTWPSGYAPSTRALEQVLKPIYIYDYNK